MPIGFWLVQLQKTKERMLLHNEPFVYEILASISVLNLFFVSKRENKNDFPEENIHILFK